MGASARNRRRQFRRDSIVERHSHCRVRSDKNSHRLLEEAAVAWWSDKRSMCPRPQSLVAPLSLQSCHRCSRPPLCSIHHVTCTDLQLAVVAVAAAALRIQRCSSRPSKTQPRTQYSSRRRRCTAAVAVAAAVAGHHLRLKTRASVTVAGTGRDKAAPPTPHPPPCPPRLNSCTHLACRNPGCKGFRRTQSCSQSSEVGSL